MYSVVKHKKTGALYKVYHVECINATNAQDGQEMVLYCKVLDDNKPKWFVREKKEFYDKFEPW